MLIIEQSVYFQASSFLVLTVVVNALSGAATNAVRRLSVDITSILADHFAMLRYSIIVFV